MYVSRLHRAVTLALSLAVLTAGAGCVPALAQKPPASGFETKATYAVVMDAGANLMLFEKDADTLMVPASMSKMMTLAVLFREMKAGRFTLDSEFKVSEHAWRTGGAPSGTSAMFAPLNTMVKISDLIPGVTVQSANDGAIIIAEGVAGTEEAFAKEMTAYARKIGMEQSTFVNATGLPAEGQLMTARELAVLARHLVYTYPEYYHFFGMKEFRYRDKFTFHNRNPLVLADIGVDGLKTGFVKESGYGLTISGTRGNQRLIVVVNGLATPKEREAEARRLLEWGFKSFKPFRLFDEGEKVSDALVWGGTSHYVPLVGDGNINIILPVTTSGKVSASIVYDGPIKAPIKKGDQVAILRITSDDSSATNEIPLYAGDDIGQSNFAYRGLDSLLLLAFGWLL
ncbi:D-alanyl-D-alanine carboxypeptidase family protein [Methyloceanibacter sp.]|uniref:D-alanyl-D-alanine carboxypeptidase family protein n=1 Tax=Methyloceanibacter sp. TaxID=1965321 RepID=UPI00351AF613